MKYKRFGPIRGVARPRARKLDREGASFELRRSLRAWRDEGRALTGFEAAKVVAAGPTKSETLELAARFGLRFSSSAPKRLLVAAFYDALLRGPRRDPTGRLVEPRYVYRPGERKFIREDKEEKRDGGI